MSWTTAESTFAEYQYGESEYPEAELGESTPEVATETDTENVFFGEDENILALLSKTPSLLDDPYIPGVSTTRRPWEHLIYA
jgi:hypothetical protein